MAVTRNISRFFAMNSLVFSRSRRTCVYCHKKTESEGKGRDGREGGGV